MNNIKKTLTILTFGALMVSPLSWAGEGQGPDAAPVVITDDGAILRSIEADPTQIISEILAIHGGQTEDGGAQLGVALGQANAEHLLAARDATSVDELNSILLGSAPAFDGILTIGDSNKDYSFTPVTPCRIVDTRFAGGNFTPGQARGYYVYGTVDVSNQGGNAAGCPAPSGEPLGVALNVTAVGVSGNGNFVVYPSNVAAPSASLVNYRTGVQNVANAASIKTFAAFGPTEIGVLNSFGSAHVVIDVLGYYYAPSVPVGVEYAGGNQSIGLTATDITARSISVTLPQAGNCIINASGYINHAAVGSNIGRCSITTGTAIDFNYLIFSASTGSGSEAFGATRGYSQAAGTTTYRLVCDEFIGDVQVVDTNLTAMCSTNRY